VKAELSEIEAKHKAPNLHGRKVESGWNTSKHIGSATFENGHDVPVNGFRHWIYWEVYATTCALLTADLTDPRLPLSASRSSINLTHFTAKLVSGQ